MTDLLKGSKDGKKPGLLEWTKGANVAFWHLRNTFTSEPFLHHYDPNERLRLEINASRYGLGAVLSQPDQDGHWRPIAFWSRKLIPAKQNNKTHDQELLAMVAAMKQWRHYLEGSLYTIVFFTNHNNLRGFMKQKKLNSKQAH